MTLAIEQQNKHLLYVLLIKRQPPASAVYSVAIAKKYLSVRRFDCLVRSFCNILAFSS